MQTFIYTDALESFMQIMLLAFTLSLPVCFIVENLKNAGITDKRMCFMCAALVSCIFGYLFSTAFSEMDILESVWLMILIWLGSQGFYEYLKDSDSFMGKMFVSLSERTEMSKAEDSKEGETVVENNDLIFPVNYIGISTAFSSFHPAVDFGFSNAHGGKFQPIIAPSDMEVVSTGESPVIGKYIRAYATVGEEEYTYRFIHMSSVSVKEGESVKKGENIGKMGNTGSSSEGYHLHFDIWKGHVGDMSSSADRYKRSIDPLKVCVLGEGQIVGDTTDRRYDIRRK